ncbi:MAG: maleylpyruvate isomerase family mycothiol-dependent enzyme [Chloroflexota bacterium]|nr:maleylpyruvate isomerase family mycothiol-dependent enzyme [Chloroflexota bacterium]
MEAANYIDALELEGTLLADTAELLPLDAKVPTCPNWTLVELLRHTAGVHRWAGEHARSRRTSLVDAQNLETLFGTWPAAEQTIQFYRDELALLVRSLHEADETVAYPVFLREASPATFWPRRQLHEATIHRADVEGVAGRLTAVSPELGADGLDEFLCGFVPRGRKTLTSPTPISVRVECTDIDRSWRLEISDGLVVTTRRDARGADYRIAGAASDLMFALWNRHDADGIDLGGDSYAFDLVRNRVKIRW